MSEIKILKILTSLLFTLIFSFSVSAEDLEDQYLIKELSTLLENSSLTAVEVRQGWVVSSSIIRCSIPEGTIDINDETYCAIDTVDLTTSNEEIIEDPKLTEKLIPLLEKNSTAVSFDVGQGWYVYSAYLRCYNPAGTINPNDKLYCALEPI